MRSEKSQQAFEQTMGVEAQKLKEVIKSSFDTALKKAVKSKFKNPFKSSQ